VVLFANLPVLIFPLKAEEEKPSSPPDSTTETIDALSDLLMGNSTKPDDGETKESSKDGKILVT